MFPFWSFSNLPQCPLLWAEAAQEALATGDVTGSHVDFPVLLEAVIRCWSFHISHLLTGPRRQEQKYKHTAESYGGSLPKLQKPGMREKVLGLGVSWPCQLGSCVQVPHIEWWSRRWQVTRAGQSKEEEAGRCLCALPSLHVRVFCCPGRGSEEMQALEMPLQSCSLGCFAKFLS